MTKKLGWSGVVTIPTAATGTTFTYTVGATANAKGAEDSCKGYVWYALMKIPNYTNTINTTWSYVNPEGETLYTTGTQTQNQTVALTPNRPISPGCIFTITLSNVAGGTTALNVVLYLYVET